MVKHRKHAKKERLLLLLISFVVLLAKLFIVIGDGVIIGLTRLTSGFEKTNRIRSRLLIQSKVHLGKVKNRGRQVYDTLLQRGITKLRSIHIPDVRFPKITIPQFSRPTVQLPELRKPNLPKFTFRLPKLPTFSFQWKRRIPTNKPMKPIVIFPLPFFIKFRYFVAGMFFSALFFFLPLLVVIFLQDLPNPQSITYGQSAQTTKIFDRHGVLLYQIYANQNRTTVPLSSIPKHLQHATIAIEDKDFYSHPGFDISAIIRSAYQNIEGRELQGGSTITQQLMKSALLTPETSLTRKFKEVILAFWAERIYTKDAILEMYFNQIPYGGTAWGVEAASQTYFGKAVLDLNLAESAFLAGIPRAPSIYSPFGTAPNAWKKRQEEVLYRMEKLGYISHREREKAAKEMLVFKPIQNPIRAPHFVMYVKDLLIKKYGLPAVEKGGLSVTTSLDYTLQTQTQDIVTDEVAKNAYLHLTNGATLITTPKTGDILAMIGSHDFDDPESGKVNLATSLRQPGSSIKVVTYVLALLNGMTASSILDDAPTTFPDGVNTYRPVNYDGKFHGKIPLRIALANSFNIPAVKIVNQFGVAKMVELARAMGVTSWDDASGYGLSITLGGADLTMLDMATVFGTLANSGKRVDLNPFLKITDYKGTLLEEKKDIPEHHVFDSGLAFIISNILADNAARAWAFGSNSPLSIPGQYVSVKTGTSDNKRDNWTIGYTPSYVVTTWVGNNDNSPMSQQLASGITGAAPIWNRTMQLLLAKTPAPAPTVPENIVQKICMGRSEYFLKGTENTVNCAPSKTVRQNNTANAIW